jgi:hypothetical protein
MDDVVAHLVACVQGETLGPVPWLAGDVPDHGYEDPDVLARLQPRRSGLRVVG